MSRAIQSVRRISIAQSSYVSNGIKGPASSTAASAVANPLLDDKIDPPNLPATAQSTTLDTVDFRTLNKPPTVLSIRSPPSYPVYIKRGSLLSIYGSWSITSSVKSLFELLSPLRALLYGGRSFQYQKFISTKPYSLLASSIASSYWFQKPLNKTFTTVDLDGINDWAVLPKDALQVYSGPSLRIQLHTLPRYISKKLAKQVNASRLTATGLFRWLNSGFTLITGRGKVGLVASGSIYQISLNESEEILINRENIVALTTNGAHDLENCIMKFSILPLAEPKQESLQPAANNQVHQATTSSWRSYWATLSRFWSGASSFLSRQQHSAYNQLIGNKDYVKVFGPRTLLIQSSNANVKSYEPQPTQRIENTENLISVKSNIELNRNSSDYLSYVTITPKGAVFESTPDFLETVNAMKERTKKN